MREIKFHKKQTITRAIIGISKLNCPADGYYEKITIVYTPYGIVEVFEIDWKTNNEPIRCTMLKAVIEGKIFTAEHQEIRLSDNRIKWHATNFIKQAIEML